MSEAHKDTRKDPNSLPVAELTRRVDDTAHGEFLAKVLAHAQNNELQVHDEQAAKTLASRDGYSEFLE